VQLRCERVQSNVSFRELRVRGEEANECNQNNMMEFFEDLRQSVVGNRTNELETIHICRWNSQELQGSNCVSPWPLSELSGP
jgi:hypothetical protein